ncbi:sensor histidine kinase [Clostridiales bacterium COT073_COT-073]|nr:sensor histidine kinase [Clostridiales bacterium COT073_COT-073]
MNYFIVMAMIILFLIVVLVYKERQQRKILYHLNKMIADARAGEFLEKHFDESILSKIEIKFADYLKATAVSEKKLAVEKEKIKTLISDISHQTKTPIANLCLYTELLKEEKLTGQAAENVEAIYVQTEKLSFLIHALIKLSRLENGIIKPLPQRRAVSDMIDRLSSQFRLAAEQKGLQLIVNGQDCMAVYDLKWTAEALGNIIDNAVKYTDSGQIVISTVAYDLFVRIDIADTGLGIGEAEREKIFSRFYRSRQAQEKPGLGIGLYLSREIIAGQGGYIKVSSNGKTGSVFSVFLPKG